MPNGDETTPERTPASQEEAAVSPLQTERGLTSIDDSVIAKIASLAAQEVDGVDHLGGAVSGALASVVSRIRGSEHGTAGVGVEVGEFQAAVDLTMVVEYPASIHEVAESVRENVITRIQEMTSLEVVEVNIGVTDLSFPDEDSGGEPQQSRVR